MENTLCRISGTTMQNLVFTNGCFDIFHAGHLRLLKYAKSLGGILIVGINSDDSIKRIKGDDRPIISQNDRLNLLKELRCVDHVEIFDEDTPERLLREVCPDILVKGPEAKNAPIPGADFVKSYGGEVIVPDWPVEISTTRILELMR